MRNLYLSMMAVLMFAACTNQQQCLPPQGSYEPEWASLENHEAVPDWMRDAKFGIYVHWGVYSVPAYGNEQYYYYMHRRTARWQASKESGTSRM